MYQFELLRTVLHQLTRGKRLFIILIGFKHMLFMTEHDKGLGRAKN